MSAILASRPDVLQAVGRVDATRRDTPGPTSSIATVVVCLNLNFVDHEILHRRRPICCCVCFGFRPIGEPCIHTFQATFCLGGFGGQASRTSQAQDIDREAKACSQGEGRETQPCTEGREAKACSKGEDRDAQV